MDSKKSNNGRDQQADTVEFIEEAFSRNRGILDEGEQAALHATRILVAGCGSVGGAVVEPLVRLGVGGLVLADPDTYDLHNINRQACMRDDIGLPKPIVLAERARSISPLVELRTFTEGITVDNLNDAFTDVGIVFDGIDNATSPWEKYLVHRGAVQRRIPVLAGADLGGQPTLYVFDYRRNPRLGYGMVREEQVRSGREFQVTIGMLARKLPRDFLPVVRYMSETGAPWPQITYCADGIGVLATRAVVDLMVGRKLPRIIAADVHMLTRPWHRRVSERIRWVPEVVKTVRAVAVAKSAEDAPESAAQPVPDGIVRPIAEAVRNAPSRSNAQPWKLRVAGDRRLELRLDEERLLKVRDPQGIYAQAGIGCAVEAANAVAEVEWKPGSRSAAPGGVIEVGELRREYLTASGLVRIRKTDRRPFDTASIAEHLGAIAAAPANGLMAEIHVLDGRRALGVVAGLASEAAAQGISDATATLEAMRWVRGSRRDFDWDATGVPVTSLSAGRWVEWMIRAGKRMPWLYARARGARTVGLVAARAEQRMLAAGGLALVVAKKQNVTGAVDAGRALMSLWLSATKLGLAVHPVSSIPADPELRAPLLDAFQCTGSGSPLCVVRVGRAFRPRPQARPARLPLERIVVAD